MLVMNFVFFTKILLCLDHSENIVFHYEVLVIGCPTYNMTNDFRPFTFPWFGTRFFF